MGLLNTEVLVSCGANACKTRWCAKRGGVRKGLRPLPGPSVLLPSASLPQFCVHVCLNVLELLFSVQDPSQTKHKFSIYKDEPMKKLLEGFCRAERKARQPKHDTQFARCVLADAQIELGFGSC